jgi:hypothetical protein
VPAIVAGFLLASGAVAVTKTYGEMIAALRCKRGSVLTGEHTDQQDLERHSIGGGHGNPWSSATLD